MNSLNLELAIILVISILHVLRSVKTSPKIWFRWKITDIRDSLKKCCL